MIIKSQVKRSNYIVRQVESQRVIDPRIATAKGPFFSGGSKCFLKNSNYATVLPQKSPPIQTSNPMAATMKKNSPEMLMMSGMVNQKRHLKISSPAVQHSSINNQNISSNPSILSRRILNPIEESSDPPNSNLIYVLYYQDCINKYGLGYILTNGVIGFYYND